jgi:N-glycosylase/DNA lyase
MTELTNAIRCVARATPRDVRSGHGSEQWCAFSDAGTVRWLVLPPSEEEVLPGVRWGRVEHSFTPAFWAYLAHQSPMSVARMRHTLGETLREEVAACMLGGHGLPAEIGNAAFRQLKREGLLVGTVPSPSRIERCLRRPLALDDGRKVRYRFPATKASWIHSALGVLDNEEPPSDPVELRNWLLRCRGVGPKTASWVVRNLFPEAQVAILDVHICRAAEAMGLFPESWRLPRDYPTLERLFLNLCRALAVGSADLDALMWVEMRHSQIPSHSVGPARRRIETRQAAFPI